MIKLHLTPPSRPIESKTVSIPSFAGKGHIQSTALGSGIQLMIMDYTLFHPVRVEYAPPFKSTGFSFCLSGSSSFHSPCVSRQIHESPGQSALNNFPELDSLTEVMAPQRFVRLGIMMNQELLDRFGQGGLPLPAMHKSGLTRYEDSITPAMQAAIQQILTCPFQGVARQLFLEGKSLELAAYQLNQYLPGSKSCLAPVKVRSTDMERVRHAADSLCRNFETTPDLNDLARSVGMCRSKLYQTFRAVYGITPFEYLHRNRLETARNYLTQGRMNVTEAAYAVGYSSPSHFTKAFKKRFGYLPSKQPA